MGVYRKLIDEDAEAVLGEGGVMIGDGGTGNFPWLLTPVDEHGGLTEKERLYNFLHSSTRMIVEQTFGIWKNRFRCLLREMRMEHSTACLIIQTTMILHNMCMVHNVMFLTTVKQMTWSLSTWNNSTMACVPIASAQRKCIAFTNTWSPLGQQLRTQTLLTSEKN